MYPIDSQNYYIQHGLILPRRQEPVHEVVPASAPKPPQIQRQPQPQSGQGAAPRAERFVRDNNGLDDGTLSLRSRQALGAYQTLERDRERDELSILIGIDTYA